LRIGIAFSLAPADRGSDGPDDRYEEFDKPETVESIADAIRAEGHEVIFLGDGRGLLERILSDPPEFVWNIAEGEGIGRCREARVPAVLEMLGIPYSGSDPLTLSAALDKAMARQLVAALGVAVPRGELLAPDAADAVQNATFNQRSGALKNVYPLILKPAFEGSSKGIRGHCLARSESEARETFKRLASDYQQPILAEEFIAGDEVTVGLLGDVSDVEVIGSMRILPKRCQGPFVYSLEMKRDWARQVEYESPSQLAEPVEEALLASAKHAYQALGCRDLARIDFRIRQGRPYFIEANPLPGLSPATSDLVFLARGYGISHTDLIRRVLRVSLARVGLLRREPVAP
jgi:D-alanine-D-alanine ligase